MAWLLEELQLAKLYLPTFDEYEVTSTSQLTALTHEELQDRLRRLGVTRDHRDRISRLALSPRPCGASGSCFDRSFLSALRPLHAQHMGCENMGLLLYSLIRFVKPQHVLEVGAGYTSLWILQALADNDAELRMCADAVAAEGGYMVAGAEWMVEGEGWAKSAPRLHAVDDMGAAEGGNRGTAHLVCDAAEQRGLRPYLRLVVGDAYEIASRVATTGSGAGSDGSSGAAEETDVGEEAAGEDLFDMLWLDFGLGSGPRIEAFLDAWWPRLRPGGYLLMHSTLTNAVTRAWLEKQRDRARVGGGGTLDSADEPAPRGHLGAFETISFLEPHKMYQNAVSIFQKRDGGWAEPLLTTYP